MPNQFTPERLLLSIETEASFSSDDHTRGVLSDAVRGLRELDDSMRKAAEKWWAEESERRKETERRIIRED